MYKVIEYYEPVASGSVQVERGQFWWTCFPMIFTTPNVTRFYCDRPTETLDIKKFDPSKETYDNDNKTDNNEFLAVVKYKKRPVIILSTGGTPYKDRGWVGGEFYVIAPVISLRDEVSGEYRCAPEFVWNTITYQYNSLFYIPANNNYDFHEGIVHFDRLTALHQSWLLEIRPAKFTHEAMTCFEEWLHLYLYNKIRTKFKADLDAYKEMVGEDPQIRKDVLGKSSILRDK